MQNYNMFSRCLVRGGKMCSGDVAKFVPLPRDLPCARPFWELVCEMHRPGDEPEDSMDLFIYLFIQVYCPYGALGYERPTPHLFNRYQHPFGHTSGASEIILTDPIYRPVAGGETSPWEKPSCDISPRGNIPKNGCPR
jgi:hypothetical protein